MLKIRLFLVTLWKHVGVGGIAPFIFNLDNKERIAVSLKAPPPYLVNRIPCGDYTRECVGPGSVRTLRKTEKSLVAVDSSAVQPAEQSTYRPSYPGSHSLWIELLKLVNVWNVWGRQWCSWLRRCTASRKVVGSIPDGVFRIFRWYNPSGRTVAWGWLSL
jgi:hypothetical protein